jgi:hypothetical protein
MMMSDHRHDTDPYRSQASQRPAPRRCASRSYRAGLCLLAACVPITLLLVMACWWGRQNDPRHGGGFIILVAMGLFCVSVVPMAWVGAARVLAHRPGKRLPTFTDPVDDEAPPPTFTG